MWKGEYERAPARDRVDRYEERKPGKGDKDTGGEESEVDVVTNLRADNYTKTQLWRHRMVVVATNLESNKENTEVKF